MKTVSREFSTFEVYIKINTFSFMNVKEGKTRYKIVLNFVKSPDSNKMLT